MQKIKEEIKGKQTKQILPERNTLKGAECTTYRNRYPLNQSVLFRKCT